MSLVPDRPRQVRYGRFWDGTHTHDVGVQRIRNAIYSIPSNVRLTRSCRDLLSQIFVADPKQRITMGGITRHPWFLENLPRDEVRLSVSYLFVADNVWHDSFAAAVSRTSS